MRTNLLTLCFSTNKQFTLQFHCNHSSPFNNIYFLQSSLLSQLFILFNHVFNQGLVIGKAKFYRLTRWFYQNLQLHVSKRKEKESTRKRCVCDVMCYQLLPFHLKLHSEQRTPEGFFEFCETHLQDGASGSTEAI